MYLRNFRQLCNFLNFIDKKILQEYSVIKKNVQKCLDIFLVLDYT